MTDLTTLPEETLRFVQDNPDAVNAELERRKPDPVRELFAKVHDTQGYTELARRIKNGEEAQHEARGLEALRQGIADLPRETPEWIEWDGGDHCPVNDGWVVEGERRDGSVFITRHAQHKQTWFWLFEEQSPQDIMAYRILDKSNG